MTTITVTLDPAEVLNANARHHWARKARTVATIRSRAVIAYHRAGRPQMDRAHCTIAIGYPDKRARDIDNLAPTCKALIDGLVHPSPGARGILPDDDDTHLVGPDRRPGPLTRGWFTFTLTFEELS